MHFPVRLRVFLLTACLGLLWGAPGATYAAAAIEPQKQEVKKKKKREKTVLGWIEPIILYPTKAKFDAKLDTGAKTSSIDAQHIERFQDINGKEWVRFGIESPNGKRHLVERPVKRWVRIKMKRGGYMQRPVVEIGVCIAGHYIESEVNLTRRFHFNYPILIGRNMLRKRIVVDASKRHSSTPSCKDSRKAFLKKKQKKR